MPCISSSSLSPYVRISFDAWDWLFPPTRRRRTPRNCAAYVAFRSPFWPSRVTSLSNNQSDRRGSTPSPFFRFVFFLFSTQFSARGVARYLARDAIGMMKLSPITNMDYPRIPLFSFSHFYFSHYVVQVLLFFLFRFFLTFYYVLKFS